MIDKVFYFTLLYYLVSCTNITIPLPESNITKSQQKLMVSEAPRVKCAPHKSLHSKDDIQLMIDYIYNETSIDKVIEENYQAKATALRDKHLQELSTFIDWFENQPGHLKHVLNRLTKLRQQEVEPIARKISTILSEYPQLEISYEEQNNKTNELLKKLERYELLCHYNCEDPFSVKSKDHSISKRHAVDDLYCSSLQELHNEITKKLSDIVERVNNDTNNKLAMDDKIYEEKIEQIKSKLKDKALNKFGRTMYDILSLEDEYHHFIENITTKDLIVAIYAIKNLDLQIDTKLLLLEQAVEKVKYHCKSCGSDVLIRNVRSADINNQRDTKSESTHILDKLIEIKSKSIVVEVENDWKNIFNDLNSLIQRIETEDPDLENSVPIQQEVTSMTQTEKETLDSLKNDATLTSIKKIVVLTKKLQDLVKLIQKILDTFFP